MWRSTPYGQSFLSSAIPPPIITPADWAESRFTLSVGPSAGKLVKLDPLQRFVINELAPGCSYREAIVIFPAQAGKTVLTDILLGHRVEQWPMPTGGQVKVQWPATMTPEVYEDIVEWLKIIKRKIGRSVPAGEYVEGPEAFRRFDDAMTALQSKPRPEAPKD